MTEASDVTGAGELFESGGKTWSLSHVNPGLRARFGQWAKLRARRGLTEMKQDLTADEYAESLAALNDQIAAGAYNWGPPLDPHGMGSAVRALLKSQEGNYQLAALLLEKAHPGLSPAEVVGVVSANPDGYDLAARAALELPAPNAGAPKKGPSGTGDGTATPG